MWAGFIFFSREICRYNNNLKLSGKLGSSQLLANKNNPWGQTVLFYM
jgi:hypothetical protein